MFVDEVTVFVKGGRGGNGVTSFARQPYQPKGPPDGGDGGHGGSVIVLATPDVATLVEYHHRPHRRAANGRHGEGDLRRGADGDDEVLLVPVGTVVKDEAGAVLADLAAEGDEVVVAAGGRGGRGNAAFRTFARKAPRFHEFGEPAEERRIVLELKLAADVALVGFPNAGKSSLIARLSAARPKVAAYPFTTLVPNLGVMTVAGGGGSGGDVDLVVADVPGLVAGASAGHGLGHRFLRHVERALVLVHVLDCASYEQRDPREDLQVVMEELRAYQQHMTPQPGLVPLTERPGLVFLNKVDADRDTAEIVAPDLRAAGWEVIAGSAVTGEGLDTLRHRMAELVAAARRRRRDAEPPPRQRPVLRPAAADDDLRVERIDDGWRVRSRRVERWVAMTDLDNDDAVRYLQARMARAGVERALVRAGARLGDPVAIGGAVFDFEPEAADLAAAEATDVAASERADLAAAEPLDAAVPGQDDGP